MAAASTRRWAGRVRVRAARDRARPAPILLRDSASEANPHRSLGRILQADGTLVENRILAAIHRKLIADEDDHAVNVSDTKPVLNAGPEFLRVRHHGAIVRPHIESALN